MRPSPSLSSSVDTYISASSISMSIVPAVNSSTLPATDFSNCSVIPIPAACLTATSPNSTMTAVSFNTSNSDMTISSSDSSSFHQSTITSKFTTGSVLYTSTIDSGSSTVLVEIITPTPTPTSPGMAYFAYPNPRSFAPDCINQNSEDITAKGIVQNINVATGAGDYLYLPGQRRSIDASDIGVLFQGYFKPIVDGDFTFTTTSDTDDYGWIWIGSKAFTGWTGSNCDAFSAYNQHSGSVTINLADGEMLPVTILWGNHLGPGHLDFTIFSASLKKVLRDTTGLFLAPLELGDFPYPMPTQSRTLT